MRVVKTGNSHDMFSSAVPVLEDVDALETDPGVENVVWDPKAKGQVGSADASGQEKRRAWSVEIRAGSS